MTVYSDKIWKKHWDKHVKDLDPKEFEISYPASIRRVFEKLPDKMAFSYIKAEITYKDLDEYSNQFANMLIENGFKKGDVVGINLPNMPEYVIAMIGTLKAGCVVSGVSPLLSEVQMEYQINDLGSGGNQVALVTLDAIFEHHLTKIASKLKQLKLVIATSIGAFLPKIIAKLGKIAGKIPKGEVTPLEGKTVMDFRKDVLTKYSKELPKITISAKDKAFIQYTGGTTGPPKGAVLTHKNIVSDLLIFQKWLNWEFGKGVGLSGFPFFHIAGVFTCLNIVYLGWSQCLIPNPRDAKHIVKEMKKYQPSVLANVPSLYQILLKDPKFKSLDHSKLEFCVSAAAPFPLESQKEFESIVGAGKIIEAYGMTETSPLTASNPSRGKKKLGSIGLPLTNMELKLVDPSTGKEVPLGEAGEICVKGPMVMQDGYFNKPDETAKTIDKDGYMHTGDVAVMDEEGYLKIVDRTKDMIIVGGFKVFSTKVEDVLAKHPAIGMIALVGTANPERPGSENVKAFVQLKPDYPSTDENKIKEGIINFAKENLSPYEIPKIIEIVKEMPLTAVGKIDKKSLRVQK